jgi:hypothetical protein|tara:strand:- start:4583 stop:4852 length:270 start_codon:yes stop_codon:yes gene_type:complete
MVKKRITLTGQELDEIRGAQTVLETQLKRSNDRVEELECGLGTIKKLVSRKATSKANPELCESIVSLVDVTINPPVKTKVTERPALEGS